MAEKLPSGKYRTRATYTDEQGKRRSVSFTRDTAKEADYAALEFKLKRKRTASPSAMTVDEAVTKYIETNEAVLSPMTITGYQIVRRNYITEIADIQLRKLDNNILQSWVSNLSRSYSPKTVRNAYGLVSAALRAYEPSFAPVVKLPRKVVKDVIIPQRADIERLLDAAKGTSLYLPILLGAHCGMRRSEIGALTWNDVDLKKRCIHVRAAKVPDQYRNWVIKQPKSAAGKRTLDMTNAIYDYISSADKNKPLITINPDTFTVKFNNLAKKLGMEFHPHLLRHYYASVLASRGIPLKYAQMLMGHASADMINKVYAHILNEEEQKFRSNVLGYFNEA